MNLLYFLTTQFAVSEEELWRAVLSWAKRSSGVSKPTNQWTEKDNDKIREVRCNKHVRNDDILANLMLIAFIDSFYINFLLKNIVPCRHYII